MHRFLFVFIGIWLFFSTSTQSAEPTSVAAPVQSATVDFDRLEDSTIYFKPANGGPTPKAVKTGLSDLKYFGALRPAGASDAANSPPYFIFSGRPCKDCLQDIGIYAIRPFGGRPEAYVYPGKILEHKSRALVLESRSFYGKCLAHQNDAVYLVFQKERIDRKNGLQASVLIAEPGADHMEERLIERRLPKLQDTLRLVKSKQCHEIEGRNRIMLSKPLDIRVRHSNDSDSGDEDEDTKENQTDDDLGSPNTIGPTT